jgi:hypothetical protein
MNPQQLEGVREGFVFRDAPPPWVVWLVVAPLVVWLVMRAYGMSGDASPGVRRVLVALRVLLIASLLALVFNPSRETLVVEKQKTSVAVLVDTSASMAHRDGFESSPADWERCAPRISPGTPAGDRTRLDSVKAVLEQPERKRLEELAKDHNLTRLPPSASRCSSRRASRISKPASASPLSAPPSNACSTNRISEAERSARSSSSATARSPRVPRSTWRRPRRSAAAFRSTRSASAIRAALRDLELLSIRADGVALKDDELVVGMKVRNRGFAGGAATLRISIRRTGANSHAKP